MFVGIPIAAYGGLGSLFVGGGVQSGEAGWTELAILVGVAAFGTALVCLGAVIFIRVPKSRPGDNTSTPA